MSRIFVPAAFICFVVGGVLGLGRGAEFEGLSNGEIEDLIQAIDYAEADGGGRRAALEEDDYRQNVEQRRGNDYPEYIQDSDYYLDYDPEELIPMPEQHTPESLAHGTPTEGAEAGQQRNLGVIFGTSGGTTKANPPKNGGGTVLPAYCDPPNPCPIGYTSKDNSCLDEFENTSEFSRDYQGRQNCLCDSEHMFKCPEKGNEGKNGGGEGQEGAFLAGLPPQLGSEFENPFLAGGKIHSVAKKGIF